MSSGTWTATGRGIRIKSKTEFSWYLETIEDILGESSEAEIYSRLAEFPGGVHQAVDLIATGLPAAFIPERSGGETGAVLFTLDSDAETILLCVELRPDECVISNVPEKPRTVIRCSLAMFLKLAFKRLDGYEAYLDKKLNISGDIILAIGFDEWFDKPGISLAERMGVPDEAHGPLENAGGS